MKSSRGAPVKKNAHLHLVESTHQRLLVLYTCVLGRLINCALDYEGISGWRVHSIEFELVPN